jgi:hypothetical protein
MQFLTFRRYILFKLIHRRNILPEYTLYNDILYL